jgi:zinc protease
MSTAKCSNLLCYSGNMPYTPENVVMADAFCYILNLIYTETVREDAGGTYGVSAYASPSAQPQQRIDLLIQFDTDPSRNDEMMKLVFEGIEDLAKNGPTAEQLTMTKENFAKNIPENRISNRYWASCLREYNRLGIDSDSQQEAIVNSIDAEKIKAFGQALLNQGNRLQVTMNPAK